MASHAEDTRELILDAAETLFADRGIDATTVSEVHRQSGQFNKSAVQYHFGSRDGLVMAVVNRHQGPVEKVRAEMLARSGDDIASLVAALVRPVATKLRTVEGRRYLRIVPQLVHRAATRRLARPDGVALRENMERLEWCIRHLDPDVRTMRLAGSVALISDQLAARAQDLDSADGGSTRPDDRPDRSEDAFVANLEAMVTGLLTQPMAD